MANTARGSEARIAFGKQSAFGTAQTTPAYEFGLYGGSLKPNATEEPFDVADVNDTPPGYQITFQESIGDPTLVCESESAGLILYGHLGADSVATGPPKVHTLTKSRAKSFLTGFFFRPGVGTGSGTWFRHIDLFPKMVEIQAAKGSFLRMATSMIGTIASVQNAPTPTTDKRITSGLATQFTMIGATLNIDRGATPSTTQVRNLDTVNIRSEYPNAVIQQTDLLTGSYVDLGEHMAGFTCEGYLEDYTLLGSTYLGNSVTAGSAASSAIVTYGSADFTFQVGPTSSANSILKLTLPSQRITVTPMEPDLGGGAVRVSISGKIHTPASGEALTYTLTNSVASY